MIGERVLLRHRNYCSFPLVRIFIRRSKWNSTKILGSEWTADAMFSAAVMIGALLVAVCAPSLGVIADRRMIKIWWLRTLTWVGAISCVLLALSPYSVFQ